MNRNFKKKLISYSAKFALIVINLISAAYKLAFTKRTILFVTNQKIRSITFGPLSQACIILFFAWVGNLFLQSLYYNELVDEKSREIAKLESSSSYFKEEFENANEKLKKINEYLTVLTGSSQNVKAIEQEESEAEKKREKELTNKDKRTFNELKNNKQNFVQTNQIAQERIKRLEKAISLTGLNVKRKATKEFDRQVEEISKSRVPNLKGQGGPIHENPLIDQALAKYQTEEDDLIESKLEKAKFIDQIDHLIVLEKLVNAIPLSRPMKNFYITSGFGRRTDPITGRKAMHQGLDFVGVTHAKIISPSKGRVVLAGQFNGYGNAVVIDHGLGITTRYGHLHSIKVKPGQIVKKGDIIALQGNTGRSTGPHLHYEVRYKNIPLNPKKFLEAGDSLSGKRATNYVDS